MSELKIVSTCHGAKVYGKPWVVARGRPEEETHWIAYCSKCNQPCQVEAFIKERKDEDLEV